MEFQDGDVTRLPTIPRSATWQDEADDYNMQFPLEIAEGPEQKNINSGFPLEIAETIQRGDDVTLEAALFPVILSHNRGREQMDRGGRQDHADISELVTKPSPAPFQPHSVLALDDEPSYVDDVVEAD